jgi:hypothetical protein
MDVPSFGLSCLTSTFFEKSCMFLLHTSAQNEVYAATFTTTVVSSLATLS